MDRQKVIEVQRAMMQRLFALLLSLAALCDRVATGPQARRRLLLSILRRAPAAALSMVSHHAESLNFWIDLGPEVPAAQGDSPEDAAELAHYYRALAQVLLQLVVMLPQPERRPRCRDWLPLDPTLQSRLPRALRRRTRKLARFHARSRGPPSRVYRAFLPKTRNFTSRRFPRGTLPCITISRRTESPGPVSNLRLALEPSGRPGP